MSILCAQTVWKVSILGCSMGGHWLEQARVWTPHCGGWQRLLSADLLLSRQEVEILLLLLIIYCIIIPPIIPAGGRHRQSPLSHYETIYGSNRLPERRHFHTGCICLTFLHCAPSLAHYPGRRSHYQTISAPSMYTILFYIHVHNSLIKQYPHHLCTQFSFTQSASF